MKAVKWIWEFFASTKLTVVLAFVICAVAAAGSIEVVSNRAFYAAVDRELLFPWLFTEAYKYPSLTAWIYALVLLAAVFAVNTAVCTADKMYSVFKSRRGLAPALPHIVHVGFLIAMFGHLLSSVAGYKSYDNVVVEGSPVPLKSAPGISARLEGMELIEGSSGRPEGIKARLSIFDANGAETARGETVVNSPFIHDGTAFYADDIGATVSALVFKVDGELREANVGGGEITTKKGRKILLGRLYPDVGFDENGKPYLRSEDFRNPYQEIMGDDGKKLIVSLAGNGGRFTVSGATLEFNDAVYTQHVVVKAIKDPGIWFIGVGSAVLVAAMLMLFFIRPDRAELMKAQG